MEVRDFAFSKSHDTDTKEGQTLEEAGSVFLISTEAVERLGEDDIELALERTAHQRLKTRPQQRRPRNSVIVKLVGNCPTLTLGERTANADLVGDRRLALVI